MRESYRPLLIFMYYMQSPRAPTQKNGPQFFASTPFSYMQVIRHRRPVIY